MIVQCCTATDEYTSSGATNSKAEFSAERPCTPKDVLATVYRHLGIDFRHTFDDYSGRPIHILSEGNKLTLTPPNGFLGKFVVRVTATDGLAFSPTRSFVVTVVEAAQSQSSSRRSSSSNNSGSTSDDGVTTSIDTVFSNLDDELALL